MVELTARVAIESLLRATNDDATPIIRRLARIQARAFLDEAPTPPTLSEDLRETEDGDSASVVSRLILRLAERQKIMWGAPDKEGQMHQLVDADDLSGAIYALSAFAHRLAQGKAS